MNAVRTTRRTVLLAIAAVAAVVLISSTSAIAVSKITSAQIKDNAIQSRDVRNGSLRSTDLTAATRTSFTRRGYSGWEKIPSGTTVTGAFRYQLPVPNPAGSLQFAVTLPGIAPTPLLNADVNFQSASGVSDADAACTGTAAAPTAPSGKVCLYLSYADVGTSAINGIVPVNGNDRAFAINWNDTGGNDTAALFGTWAYTAP